MEKGSKRKNKPKSTKSSSKDVEFITLQQQHKEKISKMDKLVKAWNEQNKLEEMKMLFMDTSGMIARQLKFHEMLCNMIREKYNVVL